MPSAADLQKYLLPSIGQPVDATLTDTDTFLLLQAANKGLSELLSQRLTEDRSERVRAPLNVTVGAVTEDSKAITFADFADWMLGCSIRLGSMWNRLVKPGSAVSLELPYDGPSATSVAATVYQDCINLDYTLEGMLPPITLSQQYPLTLLPHKANLDAVKARGGDLWTRQGLPEFGLIEDSLSYQSTPSTRVLLDALPLQKYTLSFTALLKAPQISSFSDPTPFFLPGGNDALILFPVVRDHLRVDHPSFILDAGEVKTAAENARRAWADYNNKGSQPGVLDHHP
jgi:hypothetical protein